jgi:hypothetical protein
MSRTPFFAMLAVVACVLGGCARPASQPVAAQPITKAPVAAQPIAAHPIIDYTLPTHEARAASAKD